MSRGYTHIFLLSALALSHDADAQQVMCTKENASIAKQAEALDKNMQTLIKEMNTNAKKSNPGVCSNSLLRDSYKLVQSKKRNVGIKLDVTEDFLPTLKNQAKDAASINKTSRRLFIASTMLLTGSSIAYGAGLAKAHVGHYGYTNWAVRYAIAAGKHPVHAKADGLWNAAELIVLPALTTLATGAGMLEHDDNGKSSLRIKKYVASLKQRPTEKELIRLTLALNPEDIKNIVEAFVENTINQPEASLVSKSKELIAKYSSESNGIWGGNGADYTEALASTEQAKADLYKFQLGVLEDLEKDLERVCLNQNKL